MSELFMHEAIKEAKTGISLGDGGPFGAVIVKNGEIVGRGHNMVVKNNDPTAHAEVMAIRDACSNLKTYDLSGCTIYSTGQPCSMCYSALMWANVQEIYYSCPFEYADNVGFRDTLINEHVTNFNELITNGDITAKVCLMHVPECDELYKDWNESSSKKLY